jgi:hypothetical protein
MLSTAIYRLRRHVVRRTRALWRSVVRHDRFATHLPVLIGIGCLRELRTVLELGSGWHSTRAFLDRQAFPDLRRLLSLEDDPRWAIRVRRRTGGDDRHTLVVARPLLSAFTELDFSSFDLVLVDDGQSAAARCATLRHLSARTPRVLVVHDFENPAYAAVVQGAFRDVFVFDALDPATGVLSNGGELDSGELARLNAAIASRPRLRASRRHAWTNALRATSPNLRRSR